MCCLCAMVREHNVLEACGGAKHSPHIQRINRKAKDLGWDTPSLLKASSTMT